MTPIVLSETVVLVAWVKPTAHVSPPTVILLPVIVMFEPLAMIEALTMTFLTTAPDDAWIQPRLSHTHPGPEVMSCGTRSMVAPAGTPVLVASGYPQRLGRLTQLARPDDEPAGAELATDDEPELVFVVLFVGDAELATAVTVGVLDGVDVVAEALDVLAEGVADVVAEDVLRVGVLVALPWLLCGELGVTPGVVADGDGTLLLGANVRSTQYWLACQVLVGNALVPPYV